MWDDSPNWLASRLEDVKERRAREAAYAALGRKVVEEREVLRRVSVRRLAAIEGGDVEVLRSILADADRIRSEEEHG